MIQVRRSTYLRLVLAATAGLLLSSADASAQQSCPASLDGPRLRLATPERSLRTGTSLFTEGCTSPVGSTLRVLPATAIARFRSAYPYDLNDGALWSGRGLNVALAGGIGLSRGALRISLDPTVTWSQNRGFETAGATLRDPYEQIDWPQRPRTGAFATIAGGQTAVAVAKGSIELALSDENLWWGPARRYPILLGNTAPGFGHVRLGTRRPLDIGIGRLDLDLLWGRLDESPQFDTLPDNDHRLFTGFFFTFEPKPLPGLALGLAGVQHNAWTDARSKWLNLYTFPFNEEEHTSGNGLISFTARWRLEESDTEIYLEWARDDYWADLGDLITEPDHTQGYLLGFEKLVPGSSTLRVSGELVHLGNAGDHATGRLTDISGFYSHSLLPQGHTHQGQLLGAATGPGSNAQFLSVERLGVRRTLGAYLERVRRDDDTYYVKFASTYKDAGYDIELTGGLTGEERRGGWTMQWGAAISRRRNRGFMGMEVPDTFPWHFPTEWNVELTTRMMWVPNGGG